MGRAGDLVRAAAVALDAFGGLASTDLRTYPHCVNPAREDVVTKHYQDFVDSGRPGPPLWMPASAWSLRSLKATYDQVQKAKAGACTDLAVAAAYVLATTPGYEDVRIEIVSWRSGAAGHTFLVVGRTDVYGDKGRLPEPREWKGQNRDAWYVVDPWAAAMGYDVAYRGIGNYPYRGMLSPLTLVLRNV